MAVKSVPHEIVIEIDASGKITGTVKGVTGKACTTLSAWLDLLGSVEVDLRTPDYDKPEKVHTVGQRKAGQ